MEKNGISWTADSIFPSGPLKYIRRTEALIRNVKPDWVVGFSDTYYGILAQHLGRKYKISSLIDAYDNYESYIPYFKPLHFLWRKAISKATIVTASGPHLGRYLGTFRPDKKVHVVPMAADPTGFKPLDRMACRRKLDLPLDKKLVGYCGSLFRNRGIKTLYQALEELCSRNPSVEVVISGRKEKGVHLPEKARWLGYLPDDYVPILLNSLDVFLVVNKLSAFGNFSYPVKLYEAMQCCVPVVATNTPAVGWVLSNERDFLAHPEDPGDLVRKIQAQLFRDRYVFRNLTTWEKSCTIFERKLLSGN